MYAHAQPVDVHETQGAGEQVDFFLRQVVLADAGGGRGGRAQKGWGSRPIFGGAEASPGGLGVREVRDIHVDVDSESFGSLAMLEVAIPKAWVLLPHLGCLALAFALFF